MNIRILFKKLHQNAVLPSQAHETDTGYDLTAVESIIVPSKGNIVVETGLQVAFVEPGYWFQIMPRSGLGFKYGINPHLGVIDQEYTGKLGVKLYNLHSNDYEIKCGDRIAQIIFYPLIKANISWSDTIIESKRGDKGFGSSGR